MDNKALEAFTGEAAKSIKTESDLKMFTKVSVEKALNVEHDEHLSYQKYQPRTRSNSAMATRASQSLPTMERLISTFLVTVKPVLTPN
ncbi:hypothetical protein GCM10007932_39440 [Vibrio penaeicida]|uniref:Uncharacterized protein n=1 Tax=Vibrio penaeicida TaxID=104609 RepID=A0AAV5NVY1_9VIBR|nr:hypothetical protein GCM10007932_39440 [Vibrio penaeicida]